MNCRIFTLITIALLGSWTLSGQPLPDSPKVGLVLSGGGAKGYAHIGVLKVLEDAGVKIDYIGGTSMGAIVGGLYACGYSANQLDSIFREMNPERLLFEEQARWSKSFFDREHGEKYALSLPVDEFDILFPTALSSGQLFYDKLAALTLSQRHSNRFDSLPIPFLCVATDLETGDQVVLQEGYLPDALRASGSFPTLLAPVELNGRLLSDGGIVNNFPVEEVRAKGVDVIIGVSVEDGLYSREELNSVFRVVEQIGSFRMAERSAAQQAQCDILIRPDISGYTVTSFEAFDTLLTRGEQAGKAVEEELENVAALQRYRADLPKSPRIGTAECENVRISAVEVADSQQVPAPIEGFWEKNAPTPTITACEFFRSIHQLRAAGYYQSIHYRFRQAENQTDRVTLSPRLNGGYRRSLKLGLHYDDVYGAGLLLNLSARQVGFHQGRFSLDIVAGQRFRTELVYLVDRGRKLSPGFRLRWHHNALGLTLPSGSGMLADPTQSLTGREFQMNDLTATLDLRLTSNGPTALGLDASATRFTLNSQSTVTSEPRLNSGEWYLNASAFFKSDTRDHADIPNTGWKVELRVRPSIALTQTGFLNINRDGALYLDAQWETTIPLSQNWHIQTGGRTGLLSGAPLPPFFYYMGGFNRNFINHFTSFPGLGFSEITASQLLTAFLHLRYRINPYVYLLGGFQTASFDSFPTSPLSHWRSMHSFMASLLIDTPLGPLQLSGSTTQHEARVYFNFGHWF
jgi:NTE family protein